MPSSQVSTFSDPAEYAAAIRGAQVELTTFGRGAFAGKIIRIDLHRLWMQRMADSLPRVARVATPPARVVISFSTTPAPRLVYGGKETPWGTVYQYGLGQETFHQSSGHADMAAMSLPVDDFRSAVSTVTHRDIKRQLTGHAVTPTPRAMANLQRLHGAAAALAESAPAVLANGEAARSLEQELVLAMIACTTTDAIREDSTALRHHHSILRRFSTLIEANSGNPLYLPEICTALGVSSRTLQRCCHEQLGVSPLRFLWLRRMHMVHRALAVSDPTDTGVTGIATRYGFWELGHFSVAYRTLFGERPSNTLHRRL